MVELKSKENITFSFERIGWTKVFFSDVSNNKILLGEIAFKDFHEYLNSLIEETNLEIFGKYNGYDISKQFFLESPTLIYSANLVDSVFFNIRGYKHNPKGDIISDFILTKKEIKKWIKILEKELKK